MLMFKYSQPRSTMRCFGARCAKIAAFFTTFLSKEGSLIGL